MAALTRSGLHLDLVAAGASPSSRWARAPLADPIGVVVSPAVALGSQQVRHRTVTHPLPREPLYQTGVSGYRLAKIRTCHAGADHRLRCGLGHHHGSNLLVKDFTSALDRLLVCLGSRHA